MNRNEEKALADIDEYGCHVLHVLRDDRPEFSYSIGIAKNLSQPEVVVVGLQKEISHFIINEYNRRAKSGETFEDSKKYGGFLGGFDVMFKPVERKNYREYFGWALWLYGGGEFNVLQVVYPTTSGKWPWDEGASEIFDSFHEQLYANA